MATTIILLATPIFFLLIVIELAINAKNNLKLYRINDSITSLSLGIISQTKRLVFFGFATLVYAKLEAISSLPRLPSDSILTWVLAFVFYDFLYYWYHRSSHQVNFLWASHVVHHQSEDYNLTTALRQTSSSVFNWVFYIPSFLIGIPAEVFFVSGALNLVYQFWVHTQLVGTLGWYETLFVTPSHHRVHHGQNPQYIDKNHGGVFILWDKLFGTFQQEIENIPVIYGIRKPAESFNPLWLNLQTWLALSKDAWLTKHWWDKIRIWFMPTGWRPEDRIKETIVGPFVAPTKYNPTSQWRVNIYVIFQYLFALVGALIFIILGAKLGLQERWLAWILISLPLVVNGILLERLQLGVVFEWIRLSSLALILGYTFAAEIITPEYDLGTAILIYFLISVGLLIRLRIKHQYLPSSKNPG